MSAPAPLSLAQLLVLARSYETTSQLRRVLAGIIDKLIQQQTAITLMVDLLDGRKP